MAISVIDITSTSQTFDRLVFLICSRWSLQESQRFLFNPNHLKSSKNSDGYFQKVDSCARSTHHRIPAGKLFITMYLYTHAVATHR